MLSFRPFRHIDPGVESMVCRLRLALLLAVALISSATAQGDWLERTWTNDEGKTIKAKFIRATETMAKLNQEGKVVSVPLDRLIQKDRDWIAAANELKKLRQWQLSDGSTHRARLVDIEGELLTLEEKSEELEISLDRLNEADRALVVQVLENSAPVAAASAGGSSSRTWTHVNGKSIEAEFRRMEGDQVVLFWQGKEVKVKLSELSDDDRQFVASRQSGIASPPVASSSSGPTVSSGPVASAPTKPLEEMTPEERAAERLRKRRERAERLAQNPDPPAPYISPAPTPYIPPPTVSTPPSPSVYNDHGGRGYSDPEEEYSSFPRHFSPPPRPNPVPIPQKVFICSKCGHRHPASQFMAGQMCQGCGAYLSFFPNDDGTVDEADMNFRLRGRTVRGIVGLVVMIFAGLAALFRKLAR